MKSVRNVFLAGSALALVMGVASADAADMMTPAPVYKAAPMMPAYNWSGFYVGLHAGALTDKGDMNGTLADPGDFVENFPISSFQKTGFTGGGQIGYNWQMGQTVLGLEADASWVGAKSSQLAFDPFFAGKGSSGGTYSSQIDWLATFRGRAGIAATPSLLLYVTGGLAVAGVKTSLSDPALFGGTPLNFSSSNTAFGWTAGFGAEYALGYNWSIKGEYLHVALDSLDINVPLDPNTFGTDKGTIRANHTLDLIRLGLNYKL